MHKRLYARITLLVLKIEEECFGLKHLKKSPIGEQKPKGDPLLFPLLLQVKTNPDQLKSPP